MKPSYENKEFSPYYYINEKNTLEPELHFGSKLIEKIKVSPNQEIGSHSHSHYYCLEAGQTIEQFEDDLKMAKNVAKKQGIDLKSYVFARNQINVNYFNLLKTYGFNSYRGNEKHWFYNGDINIKSENTIFARFIRGIDHYINLSGNNTYSLEDCKNTKELYEIPSSQFLRINHFRKLSFLNELKFKRIKDSMKYAAANGRIFHLWWHPHNFGDDINYSIGFLKKILTYYKFLEKKYEFQSLNMNEISKKLDMLV